MIAEVGVKMLEQISQCKALNIRVDDAGFELIDIEERVQHSRHDANRRVETLQQRLRFQPVGLFSQQSLQKPDRLQRLSQIMAGGGEEARFGDISLVRDLLGGVERFRGPLLFGDVREGYYDALDQAVVGPVRQYKPIVPNPVLGRNFTFNDLLFVKNNRGVADQIAIVRERREIGQRSTNISWKSP